MSDEEWDVEAPWERDGSHTVVVDPREEPEWLAEQRSALAEATAVNGEPTAADRLRLAMIHGGAIENVSPPEPLVEGWLDVASLAVLFGPPKIGKSLAAMDIACCVATGSWWHGHRVEAGDVVYVVAEGLSGVGSRIRAWRELNRHDVPVERIHWVPMAVRLLDDEMAAGLAQACADYRPKLVVIDTLNRCMAGGDENSSRDMGRFIAAIDGIKRLTGACVLTVHHCGKDASAGARGHSSLLGAVDTEIECRASGEHGLVLRTTAQKEHAEADPLRLALSPAAGGVAIARWDGPVDGDDDENLSKGARITLASLLSIALPDGVASGAWKEHAETAGVSRTSFYEHLKKLVDKGYVENVGTDKQPRYRPMEEQP